MSNVGIDGSELYEGGGFGSEQGKWNDAQLVCEGECNPDIRDFDNLVAELPHDLRPVSQHSVIVALRQSLVHTTHVAVTGRIFEQPVGWCQRWKCVECGKVRLY